MKGQDALYQETSDVYAGAIERLVRVYEADPDRQRDLVQEIHLALWLSFEKYEARCSIRTWVYRVAHNTAVSYVIRQHRANSRLLLTLEDLETLPGLTDAVRAADDRIVLDRIMDLIRKLKPLERDVMLLYLEDLDTASIAEVTGISPGHVRVLCHRIKAILARQIQRGGNA